MTTQPPFTPVTLAQRWDCSDQHIRNLVEDNRLHGFRIGRLIRIPAWEVEQVESGKKDLTPKNTHNHDITNSSYKRNKIYNNTDIIV